MLNVPTQFHTESTRLLIHLCSNNSQTKHYVQYPNSDGDQSQLTFEMMMVSEWRLGELPFTKCELGGGVSV